MASAPFLAAPAWRRDPYRALFSLGAGLAVFAVLPFVARGAGGGELGLFHPLAEIQGFLSCFVTGFLFTFLPRRTGTPAPEAWEMGAALALPTACVASAWAGLAVLAHALWLVLAAVLVRFALRRLGAPARPSPAARVWLPLSLLAGAAGALLSAVAPLVSTSSAPAAWSLGRALLAQGFVTGLLVAVGGELLGARPREGETARGQGAGRSGGPAGLQALAAAAFFASFPLELGDARLGMLLRALGASGAVALAAGLRHAPGLQGSLRRLAWLAAWLVPLGYWLAALAPALRTAALHVVFVGGFTLLTLALAAHVVLSRGLRAPPRAESPWRAGTIATLIALAFSARLAAALDLARIPFWLGVAGAALVGAFLAWAALVRPPHHGVGR